MERQDVIFVLGAIIIVLAVALFIKPALEDNSIDPFAFFQNTSQVTATPTSPTPTAVPSPIRETATPTPEPTWDGSVKKVQFVDPSTYQIDLTEYTPRSGEQITMQLPDEKMVTYAVIQGRWSGTTEIITIPFPYWELHYTVQELTEPGLVFPSINIQVMDANDPNRFVRILNPGILDPRNWKENDPRPWVERFYEGGRSYYFVITARYIKSYSLEIKIPERYT